MAKKDGSISQVHEFMVVGPDDGISSGAPHTDDETGPIPDKEDPFAGPRDWVIKWFGPFFDVSALPVHCSMGLYLVYVGNYPLFVSSSQNILIALSRHLIYSGHKITPIDLLGREILHYAGIYRQRLSIKAGLIFENNKLIHPGEYIFCYRRAASALAFAHAIPCNKYARVSYEFDPLSITNLGKRFPLKENFHVEKQT